MPGGLEELRHQLLEGGAADLTAASAAWTRSSATCQWGQPKTYRIVTRTRAILLPLVGARIPVPYAGGAA